MTARHERCEISHKNDGAVRQAQGQLVDGLTATRLADLYRALSDPTRVRIVSALSAGELCVCDIATSLGMTQSAISHQLRLLRQLNLVKNRKEGRTVFYSIHDEHVATLFSLGTAHVRHV